MQWLTRAGWFATGGAATAVVGWLVGYFALPVDVIANVVGAAIGGATSVLLALAMFQLERRKTDDDAKKLERAQRSKDIRDSLRFVRSVRECVFGAFSMTTNSKDRVTRALDQSIDLCRRALADPQLTDFPLRLSMEDAAKIGNLTLERLRQAHASVGMYADDVFPEAPELCAEALKSIDQLISNYTAIRSAPVAD